MTNKEALRRFKAVCKMCSAVDCDECKGKNAINALEWHKGQPAKDGKYLVKRKYITVDDTYITILSWTDNLYKIDEEFKDECGWYDLDGEYGYYQINDERIVEWKEII